MPRVPIPSPQSAAFSLAVCTRLGLNPEEVSDVAVGSGGDELATITVTAHLPERDVVDLFNTAGRDAAAAVVLAEEQRRAD